jgi:hypothetical protein
LGYTHQFEVGSNVAPASADPKRALYSLEPKKMSASGPPPPPPDPVGVFVAGANSLLNIIPGARGARVSLRCESLCLFVCA